MAITDQTRKRLWVKSGNRCAICTAKLVHDPTGDGGEYVTGEECHICSPRAGGPRHDPDLSPPELDDYANLILLSPDCHKIVDTSPDLWPPHRLRQKKEDHERWVMESLELRVPDAQPTAGEARKATFAARLTTGTQVFSLLANSQARDFAHDELSEDAEVELVASFLQDAEDWSEIASEVSAGDAVRTAHNLSTQLRELEEHGLWVFGCTYRAYFAEPRMPFAVACLRVVRTDNPAIVALQTQPADS